MTGRRLWIIHFSDHRLRSHQSPEKCSTERKSEPVRNGCRQGSASCGFLRHVRSRVFRFCFSKARRFSSPHSSKILLRVFLTPGWLFIRNCYCYRPPQLDIATNTRGATWKAGGSCTGRESSFSFYWLIVFRAITCCNIMCI